MPWLIIFHWSSKTWKLFKTYQIQLEKEQKNLNRTENIMDDKELIHIIVQLYYQVRLLNIDTADIVFCVLFS